MPTLYNANDLSGLVKDQGAMFQNEDYGPNGFMVHNYSALNPNTGKVEPVYTVSDSDAYLQAGGTGTGSKLVFESDLPALQQEDPYGNRYNIGRYNDLPAAYHKDNSSGFDAWGDKAVLGALGTIAGAGALDAAGLLGGAEGAVGSGIPEAAGFGTAAGGGGAATDAVGLDAAAGFTGSGSAASLGGAGGFTLPSLPGFLTNPIVLGATLGGATGLLGGSKPAGNVTTTTSIPDWQTNGIQDFINTDGHNPQLHHYYNMMAKRVGAGVNSVFEGAGRYGSGAHQDTLNKGLGDLATQIYYKDYNDSQNRKAGLLGGNYGGTSTQPYFNNPAGNVLSGLFTGGLLGKIWGP